VIIQNIEDPNLMKLPLH